MRVGLRTAFARTGSAGNPPPSFEGGWVGAAIENMNNIVNLAFQNPCDPGRGVLRSSPSRGSFERSPGFRAARRERSRTDRGFRRTLGGTRRSKKETAVWAFGNACSRSPSDSEGPANELRGAGPSCCAKAPAEGRHASGSRGGRLQDSWVGLDSPWRFRSTPSAFLCSISSVARLIALPSRMA